MLELEARINHLAAVLEAALTDRALDHDGMGSGGSRPCVRPVHRWQDRGPQLRGTGPVAKIIPFRSSRRRLARQTLEELLEPLPEPWWFRVALVVAAVGGVGGTFAILTLLFG